MAGAEDNSKFIEILCRRKLVSFDKLTYVQRLLVREMLLLVKNGHNHKFTYKLRFALLEAMRETYLKKQGELLTFAVFAEELRDLSRKRVTFIDKDGHLLEFTWLCDLEISGRYLSDAYRFPRPLSRLYIKLEGRKFALLLTDFMELKNKNSRRLFRFMAACRNNAFTCHTVSDMVRYFAVKEDTTGEEFLHRIIIPAVKEITQKNMYSFGRISAAVRKISGTEHLELAFNSQAMNHLPKYQRGKLPFLLTQDKKI